MISDYGKITQHITSIQSDLIKFELYESETGKGCFMRCHNSGINYVLHGATYQPKVKIFIRLKAATDFLKKLGIYTFTVKINPKNHK